MTSGRTAWVWTPELEQELTLLWKAGFSAAQCALRLGNITRSGVLGKVNRMGLPRRREPGKPRPKYRVSQARRPALGPPEMAAEPFAFTAGVWKPLPGSSPVRLADVTGCRWPVSDPFAPPGSIDLFCNCEQAPGKPYCTEHAARSAGAGTAIERSAVKAAVAVSRQEQRTFDQDMTRKYQAAA